MNIDIDDLRHCLGLAKELSEHYGINCLCPQDKRSVDDLIWMVREFCRKPVEHYEIALVADDLQIKGMYLAYTDGHYEVFTLAELNDRERRLVAAKELFHVVLDSVEKRSMNLLSHVQEAQLSFKVADDSEPSAAVAVELLAEVAAMEFLFPYEERLKIIAPANGADLDYAQIAKRFGLPQYIIEDYMTPQMMANFEFVARQGW